MGQFFKDSMMKAKLGTLVAIVMMGTSAMAANVLTFEAGGSLKQTSIEAGYSDRATGLRFLNQAGDYAELLGQCASQSVSEALASAGVDQDAKAKIQAVLTVNKEAEKGMVVICKTQTVNPIWMAEQAKPQTSGVVARRGWYGDLHEGAEVMGAAVTFHRQKSIVIVTSAV